MVAVSSGLIGPTRSRTAVPSSVSVWASFVWFDTVIRIGPAPTLFGDTVTFFSWITPVTRRAPGGRGRFLKPSAPQRDGRTTTPPAASSAAPPRNRRVFRSALIPPAPTLAEPRRFGRLEQSVV